MQGNSKEYVRLIPNILNPDPPIETPLVDGLVDAAGNPAEHAYEIIAFMAQSNAMPIGTKEVLNWFQVNRDLSELGLNPDDGSSPLHVGTRGNHSFQLHHNSAATWAFYEYVKQQSGFDSTH